MTKQQTEFKYSRNPFKGYKIRCKLQGSNMEMRDFSFDVYTDNTNRDSIEDHLLSSTSEKIDSFAIIHWATQEQDEATSELIDDFLKSE